MLFLTSAPRTYDAELDHQWFPGTWRVTHQCNGCFLEDPGYNDWTVEITAFPDHVPGGWASTFDEHSALLDKCAWAPLNYEAPRSLRFAMDHPGACVLHLFGQSYLSYSGDVIERDRWEGTVENQNGFTPAIPPGSRFVATRID